MTRLGPYEIIAPLGAGGMGEVYRARDTRLGRDVAVKVLPQHLSSSPEIRTRFEREARTVSSLNHPHICTLHDVGREGDTDYRSWSWSGRPRHRLSKGRHRRRSAAARRADRRRAGSRAPGASIDLKPGNVMLTRWGQARTRPGARHWARRRGEHAFDDRLSVADDMQPLTAEGRSSDVQVHVARAAGRQGRGRARRSLGAGLRALRNDHRQACLRRKRTGEPHQRHQRDSRGRHPALAAISARAQAPGQPVPSQGS